MHFIYNEVQHNRHAAAKNNNTTFAAKGLKSFRLSFSNFHTLRNSFKKLFI